ncbi:hypothetical protein MRB53_009518 [Persea americana]|uniref:Uncharacterized protein n=1 Tax=Persea americana TaxID=3435 RepID=A0ACC2LPC0_PERAE|nr:hypothetical protein MRB53_009518 [Persea americana]
MVRLKSRYRSRQTSLISDSREQANEWRWWRRVSGWLEGKALRTKGPNHRRGDVEEVLLVRGIGAIGGDGGDFSRKD